MRAATTGHVDVHYASRYKMFMKAAYALKTGKLDHDQNSLPLSEQSRRRLIDHIFRMNATGMSDGTTLATI